MRQWRSDAGPTGCPAMKRFPARLTIALLACGWLGSGLWAAARADDVPLKPVVEADRALDAVAAGDISARADLDERFLGGVMARIQGRDPTRRLEPRLDQLGDKVQALADRYESEDLRKLASFRLESLERHWKFYDRQLRDLRRDLQRASSSYSADAAALAKLRSTWLATKTNASAAALAPALLTRVDVILAQIDAAEHELSAPLDRQMKLNARANLLQASIDAGVRELDSTISYYDQRLLVVDSPTYPQEWRKPRATAQTNVGVQALSIDDDFLKDYMAANQTRQWVYTLFQVITLPLILWVSIRGRRMVTDDPELQAAANVFKRPLSAWLVLILVGTLLFYPDAPLLLHQAALMFAVIPVLRLLPDSIFRIAGSWPYIGTALFIFGGMGSLLYPDPLAYRTHLLITDVLTLLAIGWVLFRGYRSVNGTARSAVANWLAVVGWLGALAVTIAIFANMIGNVTLAEVLTEATLDSAYLGLVIYAGASVVISLLKLLLGRRTGPASASALSQHAGSFLATLAGLIRLAAFVSWMIIALREFRIFRPIAKSVQSILSYEFKAGQVAVSLGSVLTFLLSIWISIWLARTIRTILRDEVMPKMSLPRGVGNSISSLSYYLALMIGLLVSLAAAGFHVSQLAFLFGALGVGIGFGLQNIVNNFVSGLILMFERPIQPGDVVEVAGTSGKVREIGMRATTLTTFDGADVIVPNGTLLSEKLVNWTLSDTNRRVDVEVSTAYGSNPQQVLGILRDVARTTPGIADDHEPVVLFQRMGVSSLEFAIRAWTNDFSDWVQIRSNMTVRVYEALNAAGIEIAYPQHDLHLRTIAPQAQTALATALQGSHNNTGSTPAT